MNGELYNDPRVSDNRCNSDRQFRNKEFRDRVTMSAYEFVHSVVESRFLSVVQPHKQHSVALNAMLNADPEDRIDRLMVIGRQ